MNAVRRWACGPLGYVKGYIVHKGLQRFGHQHTAQNSATHYRVSSRGYYAKKMRSILLFLYIYIRQASHYRV